MTLLFVTQDQAKYEGIIAGLAGGEAKLVHSAAGRDEAQAEIEKGRMPRAVLIDSSLEDSEAFATELAKREDKPIVVVYGKEDADPNGEIPSTENLAEALEMAAMLVEWQTNGM